MLMCTGIQYGKTTTGAWRIKMAMHQYSHKDDNFLITAPTYKIMQQSTLPAFLKIMDGYGEYNKSDAVFRMYHGGTCYMRTGTEPDSIVGLTNVRHIWCDEAGKYSFYFWSNIQGRSSFKQAPITITTTPYSMNWVYHDLIKPYTKGKRDDIHLCQANSSENPYFPMDEYNRKQKTLSPARFNMLYGGQFEKMEGLVYDCFHADDNQCDPFVLPVGTQYIGGIDWGFTSPFVLVIRAITSDGRHYQIGEVYQTGLGIMDMVTLAKQKMQIWGITRFYCGPDQPGHIQEFNRHSLTAVAANNDVIHGINLHYELVKAKKYTVFKGFSPNTVDEYENYHWPDPKELTPDQDEKERNPVKQFDHAMDANRYVTAMTYHSFEKKMPRVPNATPPQDENHYFRIKRLQAGNKKKQNHENWS